MSEIVTIPRPEPVRRPTKPRRRNGGSRIVLTTIFGLGMLFAGRQAWENPPHPAVAEFKQTLLDHFDQYKGLLKGLGIEAHAPSSFSNTAESGTIGTSNLLVTDLESVQNLNGNSHASLLIPIKGIESLALPIDYSKDLAGKNPSNPIFPAQIREKAIRENVRNIAIFEGVTKNSSLVSPVDGYLRYTRRPEFYSEGTAETIQIAFVKDGVLYRISMGRDVNVDEDLFTPLKDAPTFTGQNTPASLDYRTWTPVRQGEDVASVLPNRINVRVSMEGWPSGSFARGANDVFPANLTWTTTPDPNTGDPKLVAIR